MRKEEKMRLLASPLRWINRFTFFFSFLCSLLIASIIASCSAKHSTIISSEGHHTITIQHTDATIRRNHNPFLIDTAIDKSTTKQSNTIYGRSQGQRLPFIQPIHPISFISGIRVCWAGKNQRRPRTLWHRRRSSVPPEFLWRGFQHFNHSKKQFPKNDWKCFFNHCSTSFCSYSPHSYTHVVPHFILHSFVLSLIFVHFLSFLFFHFCSTLTQTTINIPYHVFICIVQLCYYQIIQIWAQQRGSHSPF